MVLICRNGLANIHVLARNANSVARRFTASRSARTKEANTTGVLTIWTAVAAFFTATPVASIALGEGVSVDRARLHGDETIKTPVGDINLNDMQRIARELPGFWVVGRFYLDLRVGSLSI